MPSIEVTAPMPCSPRKNGFGGQNIGAEGESRKRMSFIGSFGRSLGNNSFSISLASSLGHSGSSFNQNRMLGEHGITLLDVYQMMAGTSQGHSISGSQLSLPKQSGILSTSSTGGMLYPTTHHGDLAHFAGLEEKFCSNYNCCDLSLDNMHDLLQHIEECHVYALQGQYGNSIQPNEANGNMLSLQTQLHHMGVQHMNDDDELPFELEYMDDIDCSNNNNGLSLTFTDIYLKNQHNNHTRNYSNSEFDSDISSDTTQAMNNTDDAAIALSAANIQEQIQLQIRQQLQQLNTPFHISEDIEMISDCDMEMDKPDRSMISEDPSRSPVRQTNIVVLEEDDVDKPFKCSVPNCNKTYKNPGGLKYHMQHGHSDDTKPYICMVKNCDKRYKNVNGLQYHMTHAHNN